MSSRALILENIRKNKSSAGILPGIPSFTQATDTLLDIFMVQASMAGSYAQLNHKINETHGYIQSHFPKAKNILSCHDEIEGNFNINQVKVAKDLEPVDVTIIPSSLGVAENGAVWIDEEMSKFRILPFITQHLIVILSHLNIVENMHKAYEQLDIAKTGFGVWIAGPSKTADIEQTLVVGAQGARSMSILILS